MGKRVQSEGDMRGRATGEGMNKKMKGEYGEGRREMTQQRKRRARRSGGEKGKRKGRWVK